MVVPMFDAALKSSGFTSTLLGRGRTRTGLLEGGGYLDAGDVEVLLRDQADLLGVLASPAEHRALPPRVDDDRDALCPVELVGEPDLLDCAGIQRVAYHLGGVV